MGNNTNNQLDEKIKESLSKYVTSKEASDWSRMETMLNATPQTNSFKWKSILNIFIGIAVISGGYVLYNNMNSQQPEVKTETLAPETNVSPVVTPPVTTTETKTETPATAVPEAEAKKNYAVQPEKNNSEKAVTATENKSAETVAGTTKTNKPQQIFVMGNEPVFGDMLDSSKGIVGETKEKEETKKAALTHSEQPIGWDKIINQDSLKKATAEKKKNTSKEKQEHQ